MVVLKLAECQGLVLPIFVGAIRSRRNWTHVVQAFVHLRVLAKPRPNTGHSVGEAEAMALEQEMRHYAKVRFALTGHLGKQHIEPLPSTAQLSIVIFDLDIQWTHAGFLQRL